MPSQPITTYKITEGGRELTVLHYAVTDIVEQKRIIEDFAQQAVNTLNPKAVVRIEGGPDGFNLVYCSQSEATFGENYQTQGYAQSGWNADFDATYTEPFVDFVKKVGGDIQSGFKIGFDWLPLIIAIGVGVFVFNKTRKD